ncbi:MAG TPA: hypothetical protein VFU28_05465 [Vicinamibacterales bacterium]|nr:hypothetical protein [Vicinamibacterales bacterium]
MSAAAKRRAALVAAIARDWNASGIRYVVSHGIELYPDGIGRDLDIHIDIDAMPHAVATAMRHLRDAGYTITLPPQPWHWQGRWICAFNEGDNVTLDFIPYLIWGPVVLVTAPKPTHHVGPFPVDRWSQFAKRVLMYVLTGRLPKRPWDDLPRTQDVRARCESLLGHELTGQLMTALESDEDIHLEALIPQIRRAAAWRGIVRHPVSALGLIRPWFARQLRPHRTGIAPIVALVGPEGVDKTSIMNALSEQIPAPFLGMKCRRWRRRTAGRFHALWLFRYWFHYTLARYIHDNKDSSALCVVCYDSHAVDMMIDPIRYGLSSTWGTRWLRRNIPKPDLVILVYDDLARIHGAKDEPPAEERDARLRDWLRLAKRGDTDAVVRVDAQTRDVAGRILALIMDKFIEKYGVFVDTRPRRWTAGALSTPAESDDRLGSIG